MDKEEKKETNIAMSFIVIKLWEYQNDIRIFFPQENSTFEGADRIKMNIKCENKMNTKPKS